MPGFSAEPGVLWIGHAEPGLPAYISFPATPLTQQMPNRPVYQVFGAGPSGRGHSV